MTKDSKYLLITDLCESRMFRTKQAADKFSDTERNEMLIAILLSTVALSMDTKTAGWAQDYAGQTAAFGNFDFFRPSETDLYVLLHLVGTNKKLDNVQIMALLRLLKNMGKGDTDLSVVQPLILRLERTLQVSDSRLRNARRTIMTWDTAGEDDRRQALTQLTTVLQKYTRQAEVLPYIRVLVKGEAGHFGVASTLKKAAALAGAGLAGLALGYTVHDPNRRWSVFKDSAENDKDAVNEDRATDLFGIVQGLKDHPAVERVVAVHYIADGLTALVRTKDGNAYEMLLRQAKFSRHHHDKTKKKVDVAEDQQDTDEEWEWSIKEAEAVNLTKYENEKKPLDTAKYGHSVDAVDKKDALPKGTKVKLGRSPIINPHFRGKDGVIIGTLDNLTPMVYVVKTDFRLSPYHLYAEEFDVPQSQFYNKK